MLLKPAIQFTACPIPHTGKERLHTKTRCTWQCWWGFLAHFCSCCPCRLSAEAQRGEGGWQEGAAMAAVQRQVSLMDCRGSATGISLCHVCCHPIPCNPASPCPHPITGVCQGQTVSAADQRLDKPFPGWYCRLYGKPRASCARAFLQLPVGMHIPNIPNKSCCVLAPQSRGCC